MGASLLTAMAVFVWRRAWSARHPARLHTGRASRTARRQTPFSVHVTGLSKAQAEDLLDWLEATGRRRQVAYRIGEGFSVFYS